MNFFFNPQLLFVLKNNIKLLFCIYMLKYMYPNKIELSHTAEIDFFQIFLHLTVGKDTCDRKTVKKKFWLTYILKNFQDYEN